MAGKSPTELYELIRDTQTELARLTERVDFHQVSWTDANIVGIRERLAVLEAQFAELKKQIEERERRWVAILGRDRAGLVHVRRQPHYEPDPVPRPQPRLTTGVPGRTITRHRRRHAMNAATTMTVTIDDRIRAQPDLLAAGQRRDRVPGGPGGRVGTRPGRRELEAPGDRRREDPRRVGRLDRPRCPDGPRRVLDPLDVRRLEPAVEHLTSLANAALGAIGPQHGGDP